MKQVPAPNLLTKDGEMRHQITLAPARNGYIVTIDYKTKPGSPEDFRTIVQPIMDEMSRSMSNIMDADLNESEVDRLVRETNGTPFPNLPEFDPKLFVHPAEACGNYCFSNLWEAMDFMGRCLGYVTYPEEGMGRLVKDMQEMDKARQQKDSQ